MSPFLLVSGEELRRDTSVDTEVKRRRRDWVGPGPRLSIALVVVIAFVTYLWLLSDADAHRARLVGEFDSIRAPAGAVQVGAPVVVVKPFHALYAVEYRSSLQLPGIVDFYTVELERLGWQDAGSIVGGMTTKCFGKAGDVWAAVTPLADAPAGSYVVDLTWRGVCGDPR
jgi:hypothetical protein